MENRDLSVQFFLLDVFVQFSGRKNTQAVLWNLEAHSFFREGALAHISLRRKRDRTQLLVQKDQTAQQQSNKRGKIPCAQEIVDSALLHACQKCV
jgi:hypothetical protein